MSHINPSHDPENVYPSDDYKPIQKKYHFKTSKKKEIAKKMKFHPKSIIAKLDKLVKESEGLRKYPMGSKKKKTPSWFTKNYGGHADLPPGYTDRDNE